MCYYETNHFTGCGCTRPKADAALEPCVVGQVYSRDCAADQCGPHPERQATVCFGLVCLECLAVVPAGKPKKARKHSRK